MNNLC